MKIITVILVAVVLMTTGCSTSQKAAPTAVTKPRPASEVVQQPRAATEVVQQQHADDAGEAADHVWDFRDASTWILGDFNLKRLTEPPYESWYISGYSDYQPDPACMEQLKKTDISGLTITIVLGTWCPDSRREVPRFMKLIDLWGFPVDKIRFIGVDINKVAPLDDYEALDIERVPTFIFYENNSEIGRIIEVPVASLEVDSRDILNEEYKH
jgi:thiol-disulfide isomerase/thioredoxin